MKWKAVYMLLAVCCLGMTACFSTKKIRTDGLKGIKLGEKMIPKGIDKFKGYTVKDTIYFEEGWKWRASILQFPEGRVWVEEDFFKQRLINRIRIETPALAFKRQYRVGCTIEDLLELDTDWEVVYMPEYQRVDLYSRGVHFLVDDADLSPDLFESEDLSIYELPKSKKVVAIVVM